MADFRFESPQWSAALWGVLAITAIVLFWEHRRGNALAQFVQQTMQSRLVAMPSGLRRSGVVLLYAVASICFVVALMRPQYGLTYVKTPRVGAQIMFCLDVSKSMLAEDVAPNRLERAKADITDLLSFLDGDQVGLIAFAGRASVQCPLTPDYGFFKLILNSAGPHSVGRGGTRLEEPLRMALKGFRSESDVSRVVFLITDGEDHDSQPLELAEEAIEKGVHIVAVGLGDESGSRILITDPQTGIQKTMTDADGNPVITRLDGDTLRELALKTEGVYIPAGTGALDLKSIYDAHIQPLVRGELMSEGRAIRRDAFQWAILAGLVFLFAAILVGSGRLMNTETQNTGFVSRRGPSATLRLLIASLVLSVPGLPAMATEASGEQTQQDPSTMLPRESYNQGLKQLRSAPDTAEGLLVAARQNAGRDGEVRFRATYNLGWIEIHRADAKLQEEPQKSLEHLERAAGWFRDAVRLRDDAQDARHNLEVVLLRITRLRDQLAQKEERDLSQQIDELIAQQRSHLASTRGLVESIASSDDPNIADQYRSEFQRFAVDQRLAISDLQGIMENAESQRQTLLEKSPEERSAEENVRIAQLESVFAYLGQASQRLGQGRSQLRRRQATRGFRRIALGLNQLKRARDQLRDPLQTIDSILIDLTDITKQTVRKSAESQFSTVEESRAVVPTWLEQPYLMENHGDLQERIDELVNRLAAGLKNASENKTESDRASSADASPQDSGAAEQQEFLQKLQEAMPHLDGARTAMESAGKKIDLAEYDHAAEQQVSAIKQLRLAKEYFADLRSLIELAYGAEKEIVTLLEEVQRSESESSADAGPKSRPQLNEIQELLIQQQSQNIERMQRLSKTIQQSLEKELKQSAEAQTDSSGDGDKKGDVPPEIQRLRLASILAENARQEMQEVVSGLNDIVEMTSESVQPDDAVAEQDEQNNDADAEAEIDDATDKNKESKTENPTTIAAEDRTREIKSDADAAVESLEELRRLFFSLIEHLRETAQRQASLNDETETAAGNQVSSGESPAKTSDQDDALESDAESELEANHNDGAEADRDASEVAAKSGLNAVVDSLADKQSALSETTDQIAKGLAQQAQANPGGSASSSQANGAGNNATQSPQQQQMMQEAAEKSRQAADLVQQANTQMTEAVSTLTASETRFNETRSSQDLALEKLVEALQLLQPPDDQNQDGENQDGDQQDQSQQQQQQQPQDQQQDQSQSKPDQSQRDSQQQMDPSRVLQAVRDREAQRRKDQQQRVMAGQIPVEKDW